MNSIISEEKIKCFLKHKDVFSFKIYEETDSTNKRAKEDALRGAEAFNVYIAESQSCGRGRMGRQFYSPSGTGLYFSIILRPDVSHEKLTLLTSAAAVYMREAINDIFKISTRIKWVNDLFFRGKKVCGILCESSFTNSKKPDFLILGIGVNVFKPKEGFPDELENIAASLEIENVTFAREKLLARFLDIFFENYSSIFEGIHLDEYRRHCMNTGKNIFVISNGNKRKAYAESIDNLCRLYVKYEDGECEYLNSGEISIREIN